MKIPKSALNLQLFITEISKLSYYFDEFEAQEIGGQRGSAICKCAKKESFDNNY
jgi:hypothetical protein